MSIIPKLNIQQELELLQDDLKNWDNLFPYEKDYIINRSKELTIQYSELAGPDLTKSLLLAIQELHISR